MTIIDVNAYLGEWPFRKLKHNTTDGLIALMDRCGIDKAVVSPLEGIFYYAKNLSEVNENMAGLIRKNPERWLPFYCINPDFPCWEEDLDLCLEELKAIGIRLYPNYHGYSMKSENALKLLDKVSKKGLPINISLRFEDERVHHPLVKVPTVPVEEVGATLNLFPKASFILSGIRLSEIDILQKQYPGLKNYYIDISFIQTPFRCLELLVEQVGAEHVLFGTGMPYQYPEAALLKITAGILSDDVKEKISGLNLLQLFDKAKRDAAI